MLAQLERMAEDSCYALLGSAMLAPLVIVSIAAVAGQPMVPGCRQDGFTKDRNTDLCCDQP